jgi:hypothetical protein
VSAVQFFGRRDQWPREATYVGMPGKPSRAFGIPDEEGSFGKPWACVNSPAVYGGAPDWPTAFLRYFVARMAEFPEFEAAVRELHGRKLLCWCAKKDAPQCHAVIIAEFAEMLYHGPGLGLA